MEAVGQLTGGIAHDFNNILGIVLGNLDLARENLACGPTADHIDQAIKAAERGAELTDRLLAFARRQTLKPSLLRVDENLRDMKDLLRQAVGSDISVQIETPPQLWASYTDPVQFENAILNLALNGRDAMPDGGNLDIVAVNTVLESDFAQSLEIVPGEYVLIDITDSGTGMTDDVRLKAFEPFFTTKQVGKGSGLGLSMVQGFVQQSGGAVRLFSDEAHGTTVRVYLPRAREPALDEFEVISDHGPAIRNRPRVLVLVRDGSLRAFVREILDSLDCEARFASGQETALDGSDADAGPDLVLTDLPSNELAREEGLLGRPCRSWPIIYVTGEEIQPDHLTHPAKPGASFLQKPLEASALSRAVREALGRH
jgi:CheY-like chemotaxis protein